MTIKDLFTLLWRNIIYLALGLILGAASGYFVSKYQAPVYEASTKIFVNRARMQNGTDILSLSNEQLLAINLQMAKSQPILDVVSTQLGRKIDPDNIIVEPLPNTLIIQIKVQDNDPQRATEIANLLAQTMIQKNAELLGGFYEGFETAINEQLKPAQNQIQSLQSQLNQIKSEDIQGQLEQVNRQIELIKTEISKLETEISNFPKTLSSIEIISLSEKQAQLDQLHSLMGLYQQIQVNLTYIGQPGQNDSSLDNPLIKNLQSTLAIYQEIEVNLTNGRDNVRLSRAQSKLNVTQIVAATEPKKPTRPIPVLYVLLGGGVGLTLVITVLLIRDHLYNPIKSANQAEELLGLPVLGAVVDIKHSREKLVTILDPHSKESAGYYALGANLEITSAGKNIHRLLIVDVEPTAGITTIAANLAVINAQQGKTVILVEGDLKNPHLHRYFGVENRKGFAELLSGKIETTASFQKIKDVKGLTLILGGLRENDTPGWLDLEKLSQILSLVENYADLVIVNSPSSDSADALVWGSKVDAVVLAVGSEVARVESARAILEKYQLIGTKILGAVFYRTVQLRLKNIWQNKIKTAVDLKGGNNKETPTLWLPSRLKVLPKIIANQRLKNGKNRQAE